MMQTHAKRGTVNHYHKVMVGGVNNVPMAPLKSRGMAIA